MVSDETGNVKERTWAKALDSTLDIEAMLCPAMGKHLRDATPLLFAKEALEGGCIRLARVLDDTADRALRIGSAV